MLLVSRDTNVIDELLAAAQHTPDTEAFVLDAPEKRIAIKTLRDLFAAVSRTTIATRRLIVVPQIERITLPAAHALLKQLEEPRPANRYLLTTAYPKRLLPTILSRVHVLRVASVNAPPKEVPEVALAKTLGDTKRKSLDEATLQYIENKLNRHAHEAKTKNPYLYRALLRLRDYYKIRSFSGNEKLAGDILLASVMEFDKMKP